MYELKHSEWHLLGKIAWMYLNNFPALPNKHYFKLVSANIQFLLPCKMYKDSFEKKTKTDFRQVSITYRHQIMASKPLSISVC